MPRLTPPASPRIALAVWGVATLSYILAVAGRSSFGVSTLAALERFDAGPAVLSTFVVVQVGTYAAAQIPVGLAIDRWGPRRVLVAGAVLMALAQLVMALSTSVGISLVARFAVGLGDATSFISVLRLVPEWFALGRVPLFNQLTSVLGQLGQVLSAVPFVALLTLHGWEVAYLSLAASLLLVGLAVAVVVRDRPAAAEPDERDPDPDPHAVARRESLGAQLRAVARTRGVWAGLFAHWATMFPVVAFALMWGVPYMRAGNGISAGGASAVLVVGVVAMVVAGPVVGSLSGRLPHRRLWIVAVGIALPALGWTLVLVLPPPVPLWAFFVMIVPAYVGSSVSNVGFDITRSHVSRERLGTATGLTNAGGFTATLLAVLLVGIVLDVLGGADPSPQDYRVAMAAQGLVLLVGVVGLLVAARRLGPGTETAPPRDRDGPARD